VTPQHGLHKTAASMDFRSRERVRKSRERGAFHEILSDLQHTLALLSQKFGSDLVPQPNTSQEDIVASATIALNRLQLEVDRLEQKQKTIAKSRSSRHAPSGSSNPSLLSTSITVPFAVRKLRDHLRDVVDAACMCSASCVHDCFFLSSALRQETLSVLELEILDLNAAALRAPTWQNLFTREEVIQARYKLLDLMGRDPATVSKITDAVGRVLAGELVISTLFGFRKSIFKPLCRKSVSHFFSGSREYVLLHEYPPIECSAHITYVWCSFEDGPNGTRVPVCINNVSIDEPNALCREPTVLAYVNGDASVADYVGSFQNDSFVFLQLCPFRPQPISRSLLGLPEPLRAQLSPRRR